MTPDLSPVPTTELVELLRALRAGQVRVPLTRAQLQHLGCVALEDAIGELGALDRAGLEAVVAAVLAERSALGHRHLEVVWTGPEPHPSATRDTRVVVKELFSGASESVLVAGFRFDHGADILAALHARMKDEGVEARFFLDVYGSRPGLANPRAFLDAFLADNWPFGPPHPRFYFDPRALDPAHRASLHAKCVVVDQRRSLVTSANFTDRGQTRNVELGLLIDDQELATRLTAHWFSLVHNGLMRELAVSGWGA